MKHAKAIICILTVVCLVLGGLLVWSRIDAAKINDYKTVTPGTSVTIY